MPESKPGQTMFASRGIEAPFYYTREGLIQELSMVLEIEIASCYLHWQTQIQGGRDEIMHHAGDYL